MNSLDKSHEFEKVKNSGKGVSNGESKDIKEIVSK